MLGDHVAILDELRDRGVLRSANNPTGDYAEHLCCRAFGWDQAVNSEKSYDAMDGDRRIQIKGRRLNNRNPSRQLSAIRDLAGFDLLAGVLFDHHYRVFRAVLVPASVVASNATYVGHTNSNKLILRDAIWSEPGVTDITQPLRNAQDALE